MENKWISFSIFPFVCAVVYFSNNDLLKFYGFVWNVSWVLLMKKAVEKFFCCYSIVRRLKLNLALNIALNVSVEWEID